MNDAFHSAPIEEIFIKRGEDVYISMRPLERALVKEVEALELKGHGNLGKKKPKKGGTP